jgi:hypothetical protein
MRFDEINIIGEFKINGLTGSPGQALGLSGSDFTWITVSASSVIDAVGLTGTDYVICQSVNTGNPGPDAIENGNRLKSAYATASALYVSNRVSVLITPGDYDLGAQQLYLTTNNVDLIGLSSDASDVILRGSGDYVLQINAAGVDTALCNVTLDANSNLYAFDNGGQSDSYLRWDNVIVTGNMFSDDSDSYTDLNGEFKNIKVYNSTYAFYTLYGNIDGEYDNIELTDVTFGFYPQDGYILGTYSNIKLSGTNLSLFRVAVGINATFENIKTGNIDYIFYTSDSLNGTFKNIEIGDVANGVFSSTSTFSGTFENIKIGNVSQNAFSPYGANITGTFSDIQIGDCTNAFYCETSGTVSGTYQNIEIGNVSGNLFYTEVGNIEGTYKNIKTGDISQMVYINSVGNINGVFENIEIGNVSGTLFFTEDGNIQGTYKNIKIRDVDDTVFRARNTGNIDGIFIDIEVGNVGLFIEAGNILRGNFSNIKVGDGGLGSRRFRADSEIDVVLDLLEVGNCVSVFSSSGTVSGTYSNIQMGNVTDVFESNFNLTGTYENIKIGTCSNAFVSNTSDINGYFDTIEIGGVGNNNKFRGSNGNLYGTYKNMKFANTYNLFSVSNINATFENIEFNGNGNKVFHSTGGDISGTFSNITSSSVNSELFVANNIYGYYKDITLGTASSFMSGTINSSTVLDNLKVNGYIQSAFTGRIINSFVDARSFANSAITLDTGAIVERCKFLSDSGLNTVESSEFSPGPVPATTAKVSFTIANYGINIINEIGTPLNIDNPNIT